MALTTLGLYGGPQAGSGLPTGYTGAVLLLGSATLTIPGTAEVTLSTAS